MISPRHCEKPGKRLDTLLMIWIFTKTNKRCSNIKSKGETRRLSIGWLSSKMLKKIRRYLKSILNSNGCPKTRPLHCPASQISPKWSHISTEELQIHRKSIESNPKMWFKLYFLNKTSLCIFSDRHFSFILNLRWIYCIQIDLFSTITIVCVGKCEAAL